MPQPARKITVPAFREQSGSGRGLTMLTAYDHLWAGIFDEAGVDSILVGDSLAMGTGPFQHPPGNARPDDLPR